MFNDIASRIIFLRIQKPPRFIAAAAVDTARGLFLIRRLGNYVL